MQTITLTKDNFEGLIILAFLDGKLSPETTAKEYFSGFYEKYKGIFESNKLILKPVFELLEENGIELPEIENLSSQGK